MRSLPVWVFILIFFLTAAGPVLAGDWAGKIVTIDGTVHVQNPAVPAESEIVLTPERLWSIGGDDDNEQIFGAITRVLVDSQNNTYLLDFQISQVMVYGPEGDFLRTLGRSGEGPGEFRSPLTMCFLPGEQLGVVQMMPTRIVVFDTAGEPLPDFPVPGGGGFATVQEVQSDGENIVVALQNTAFDNSKITLQGQVLRLDRNGDVESTLWTRDRELNLSKMVIGSQSNAVLPFWTVGGTGNVFLSKEYNEYRIEEIGAGGKIVRIIEREFESRKRTDEQLAEMKKRMEDMPAQAGNIEVQFDDTDRDILLFVARDNGELWVMSSRAVGGPTEGEVGPFEVFDREGRYIRDVRITVDCRAGRDEWHILKDRMYVIKGGSSAIQSAMAGMMGGNVPGLDDGEADDDLGPPEVVCYKLGYSIN